MIKEIKSLRADTLVYDIEEYLTVEELDVIDKGIETLLKAYNKVNLMLYIDIKSEDYSALIKEIAMGMKYWNKINKIAYIGDHKKWGSLIVLDDIFTKFKEKYFELEQIDKAWEWLSE